jgi:hypothetical protein
VRAALAAKQHGAVEQAQQLLLDVFHEQVLPTFFYEVRVTHNAHLSLSQARAELLCIEAGHMLMFG